MTNSTTNILRGSQSNLNKLFPEVITESYKFDAFFTTSPLPF